MGQLFKLGDGLTRGAWVSETKNINNFDMSKKNVLERNFYWHLNAINSIKNKKKTS